MAEASENFSESISYEFKLTRLDPTRPPAGISVDFSPREGLPSLPILNKDGKIYTPMFTVSTEKTNPQLMDPLFAYQHQRRFMELTCEKSQLFVPRPSCFGSICCVCKSSFSDYLTHIKELSHVHKLESSTFGDDIKGLCKMFADTTTCSKKPAPKIKKIRKNAQTCSTSALFLKKQFSNSSCTTAANIEESMGL